MGQVVQKAGSAIDVFETNLYNYRRLRQKIIRQPSFGELATGETVAVLLSEGGTIWNCFCDVLSKG